MCPRRSLYAFLVLFPLHSLGAADKNGVSPQAISLPTGPGSIQGLGESFQPQLNHGGVSYTLAFPLPGGTAGHTPQLQIDYDSGAANGPFGLGWVLSGAVSVTRNMDLGVPRYVDGPNGVDDDADDVIDNPQEIDVISGIDREELVPLADGSYRAESESAFTHYQQSGEGWIARRRDGTSFELGMTPASRIEEAGRVYSWLIDRVIDTDGNTIVFEYVSHPDSPGQKYLRRIRWGQPAAGLIALFTYAPGRPDEFSDFRSGFEIRTALRAVRMDVLSEGLPARADALKGDLDGNGIDDALIRRWTFEYHAGAPVSLLSRVTQLGCDGATALPPATFEYTRWTPPSNVAALVVASKGEPAETPSSSSSELIDMNGDGLPDLLVTSGNQHRVANNLGMAEDGRLEWGPLSPVGNAPTIDIGAPTAHLADATADGLSDLIVKVSNTRFLCFDNTSQNSWTMSPFPIQNTDTWPIWPFDGANGTASRSMDTDRNRRNDILFTSESGYGLWLFLPGGQYAKEMRLSPLVLEGKVFRFDLPGTHIADLNGDRLPDLAWVQPTRVAWFPNLGRGRFGAPQVLPLGRTLTSADIEKAGFSDIDGDDLEDLTVVRPASASRSVLYWLNRFRSGLEAPRQLDGLPAAAAGDTLRWADMNGNGSTDIVIANSSRPAGQRLLVVELLPEGKPYVLSSAANGLGLVQRMELEASVDQMVRARRAGTPWASTMQISVPVVRRLIEDDSRGSVTTREITYRDPYWNPAKQEFRGFQSVQMREVGDDSAADRVSRHRFDAGFEADCMKGKLLLAEVLDQTGKVFSRTENLWTSRVLARGTDNREVCFAFAARTDTTHVEGSEEAIVTRVERDYDSFGNQTLDQNLGIVDVPGDEVVIKCEYDVRQAPWIIDLLKKKTIFDGAGNKVAEGRYDHDARGRMLRYEAWLDGENRFIVMRRQSYDPFGSLFEVMDAKGHGRSFQYDPLLHAYPVEERIHLEDGVLQTVAEYDLGQGTVLTATDFNGVKHTYGYDALGRIVRLLEEGGARTEVDYQLASPVSRVVERKLEGPGGGTFESFAYFDAYGRSLGTKVESEGGKWRFLDARRYNSRKLVSRSWLPLETAGPEYMEPSDNNKHDAYFYDAMARVTDTVHLDGTSLRNVYRPLSVDHFDENDTAGRLTPSTVQRDGLGRVAQVVERNGAESYVTSYRWTPLGRLVEIHDAHDNVKSFEYDSLQRLREMRDPDRGTKRYFYDDAGNLVRTVDAKGQEIRYLYDFANRLLEEEHGGGSSGEVRRVRYRYDAPSSGLDLGDGVELTAATTAGRLASVADASGETHFSYDSRGNQEWIFQRIQEPRSGLLAGYLTRFDHDLLDRVTELVYPDGDRVRFTYNDGNVLQRIDGGPGGFSLVDDIAHHPSGQVSQIRFANGVESSFVFDIQDRLSTLMTLGPSGDRLIDNQYRYDPASNVTRIVDRRPFSQVDRDSPRRNTQVFTHDGLNRLTQVRYAHADDLTGNLGQIDFAYDAIGNLIGKSTPAPGLPGHMSAAGVDLGAITYGSGQASGRAGREAGDPPGPHAATGTASGKRYDYDANGNMMRRDDAALAWDDKDLLIGFQRGNVSAAYAYDYSDRRVSKVVESGDHRSEETIYVNRYFEERPGRTPVKFVFDGSTRIARIEGSLDPGAEKVQRIRLAGRWTAVTAAVSTGMTLVQAFGAGAEVYAYHGGGYERLSADTLLAAGEPLWVHVPAARLVVLKGPELVPAGPIAVAANGTLIAWPSLQAFAPEKHLSASARVLVYDGARSRWLLSDPSLPSFLQDFRGALPSAGALWIDAQPGTRLLPPSPADPERLFYHADHLGSTSVVTDRDGRLEEEIAYFPFGQIRNRHSGSGAVRSSEYGFTDKETDAESGLTYLGARFYDPVLGRLASVDPLLSNPAALDADKLEGLLGDPQRLGLYSYVLNNPVRYFDPDGLDARSSRQMIQRTPAEAQAFSDFNYGIEKPETYLKPIPPRKGTIYQKDGSPFQLPEGVPIEPYRSSWRQVTVEFQIKDPEGKPVRNHFTQITVFGKDGEVVSAGKTDARGVVKFVTEVPARSGKLIFDTTYDEDGKVKVGHSAGLVSFNRRSGETKLKFEVELEDTVIIDSDGIGGEAVYETTEAIVEQKR